MTKWFFKKVHIWGFWSIFSFHAPTCQILKFFSVFLSFSSICTFFWKFKYLGRFSYVTFLSLMIRNYLSSEIDMNCPSEEKRLLRFDILKNSWANRENTLNLIWETRWRMSGVWLCLGSNEPFLVTCGLSEDNGHDPLFLGISLSLKDVGCRRKHPKFFVCRLETGDRIWGGG